MEATCEKFIGVFLSQNFEKISQSLHAEPWGKKGRNQVGFSNVAVASSISHSTKIKQGYLKKDTEGEGLMSFIAAGYQRPIKGFWRHFWVSLMSGIFI